MKRILFVSHALHGHAAHMVVLAKELAERGVHVSYAIPGEGQAWLDGSGVEHIPWEPRVGDGRVGFTAWAREKRRLASLEARDDDSRHIVDWSLVESYEAMYGSLVPIFDACRPSLAVVRVMVLPGIDLAVKRGVPCVMSVSHLPRPIRHASRRARSARARSARETLELPRHRGPRLRAFGRSIRTFRALARVKRRLTGTPLRLRYYHDHTVICGTHPCIEDISELVAPDIHLVGLVTAKTTKRMDPSLAGWLDEARGEPVVLVAFGSLIDVTARQIQLLGEGLARCRCRVLWATHERHHSALRRMSPSFRVESFVPQRAVLAHRAVRAFVSHCGSNSTREALHQGKPILAMPFFLDQPYFAERVVSLDVGRALDRHDFTSEEVRNKVTELLTSAAVHEEAGRISSLLQSRCGREIGADLLEKELARAK